MKCIVDFLNVGFGQATVIRIIDNDRCFCLVVDAGDVNPNANPRRCSLRNYIQEHAIEKIDVLLLTHFHRDHIGGVLPIIGKVPIGQIILHVPLPEHILMSGLNDHSTPMLASLSLYKQIINQAKELDIPLNLIEQPYTIHEQGVEFNLLMPSDSRLQQLKNELDRLDLEQLDQQQERLQWIDLILNETALAVLIRYNESSVVLLTSDVALDFWELYTSQIKDVHIVQAPHHGDARHMSGPWLRNLSPKYVIVSADDEGTYQLPHPEINNLIREHTEAEIYYTEGPDTTHRIIRMDVNDWEVKLIK
ncbi:ComEC/Rec2 family competence protein [Paenibacillus sp. KN14-4R]|uniref:ComEC/Rec2 family competence protein n=1 Tax=Paenibacillus sp. KN14-4R TaxID=3445773 RepID=UPI003FA16A9A